MKTGLWKVSRFQQAIILSLVATALLAVALAFDRQQNQIFLNEEKDHAAHEIEVLGADLERVMNERLRLVEGLVAFRKSRGHFTEREFLDFAYALEGDRKGIRSLQLAPNAVVTYMTHPEANAAARGHDLLADPQRAPMVRRAIERRDYIIAGPLDLIQGGRAIISRLPIFLDADTGADGAGGERFWGLATIVLDVDRLLEEAGIAALAEAEAYAIALRGKDGLGAEGAVFYGPAELFEQESIFTTVALAAGTWQIAALPKDGWPGSWPGAPQFWVAALAVIAFITWSLRALMRRPGELREAVDQATSALRDSETRLNQAVELAGLGHWVWDALEDRCIYCSEENARIHGMSVEDYIAKGSAIDGPFAMVHPDDREETKAAFQELRRGRAIEQEYRLVTPAGETCHVNEVAKPVFGEDGRVVQELGTIQDITERKEAEEALRASEAQLRLVTDSLPQLFAYLDHEIRYRFVNKAYEVRYGRSKAEIIGKHAMDLLGEAAYEKFRPHLERVLSGEKVSFEESVEYPDGSLKNLRVAYVPHFDETNQIAGFITVSEDVTDLKRAEAQLQQAQKMEAVGQLTGGVAHDFNNLLAVIMGNVDLLGEQLEQEHKELGTVLRAVDRGAELTQRMVAFSRQQPLNPQALDLGSLVSDMSDLLTRTLGGTIEIETLAAPDLWAASADPGQVENALLNLALNARDAMAGGGKLTIECSNAHLDTAYLAGHPEAVEGDYVLLSISDEGSGMTAEVQAHAFEPFFTTKEVGRGSGLGLSMIYGFAKQSGGHLSLYSEEGRGTTIKLYLPRAEQGARLAKARQKEEVPRGNGEVVLVIEDDPDVRALTEKLLEGLGYRAIVAAEAEAADRALADGTPVDLVLSDVVLPGGTSGAEFAERTRKTYPDLKIIFMSGYSAEAAKRDGFLDANCLLLNKPFKRHQLARALRDALGGGVTS